MRTLSALVKDSNEQFRAVSRENADLRVKIVGWEKNIRSKCTVKAPDVDPLVEIDVSLADLSVPSTKSTGTKSAIKGNARSFRFRCGNCSKRYKNRRSYEKHVRSCQNPQKTATNCIVKKRLVAAPTQSSLRVPTLPEFNVTDTESTAMNSATHHSKTLDDALQMLRFQHINW